MTKEAALQAFFERFLTAYQEDTVPSGDNKPAFPYITYEVATGSWDDAIALSVSLWYRSTSWVAPNAMANTISAAISKGGTTVPCDNGCIYISRGTPFARSASDTDDMVRRKILNIMVEYLTED